LGIVLSIQPAQQVGVVSTGILSSKNAKGRKPEARSQTENQNGKPKRKTKTKNQNEKPKRKTSPLRVGTGFSLEGTQQRGREAGTDA
jgi:hypothetical protein